MIGDKVIITKKDIKRAKILLPLILKLKDKSVITIGGGSGTKKTELACCLQEELYVKNKKTLMISLDDYYVSHYIDRQRIRELKGIKSIGLKEIDWKLIKKIIKDFKQNKDKLILQQINKYTNDYDTIYSYGIKQVNYLIIEGLYANYLKKYKMSDFAIHIEATPLQTLKFRKRRKKEDENSNFRKKVVKKEYETVKKLLKYADKIIKIE